MYFDIAFVTTLPEIVFLAGFEFIVFPCNRDPAFSYTGTEIELKPGQWCPTRSRRSQKKTRLNETGKIQNPGAEENFLADGA